MADTEPTAPVEREEQRGGWVGLLKWSTIAGIVVLVLINVFAGIIPPLVIFAVVWLVGVIWLARSNKGPAILLLIGFIAFIGLSAPFIFPTLAVPASAGDFILNLASLLAALVGLIAAIAVLRNRPPTMVPRLVGYGAIGLFVIGAAVSVVSTLTYDDAVAEAGDVKLVTKDIEFHPTSLEADAGDVSVFVDNEDGTLHTFTIDKLDVDLDIPASKSARITFDAPPGTYKFYCRPHEGDMEGTITIR